MAKLGSYFGLCPLVDQQNLLGISEASEKSHVIVTLSKNIVVKYRISDQKQVQSWRTKDKLSSPVIFDRNNNKYVGTFNLFNLKIWSDDDEHLDKLKKYKFNEPIYTLLDVRGRTFIVFKNGNIFQLNKCIENRKGLSFEKVFKTENEQIQDVLYIADEDNVYFGVITDGDDSAFLYLSSFTTDDHQQRTFKTVGLNRNDVKLSGYVLCRMYNKCVHFLSFWSDNKLYSLQLNNDRQDSPEPFGEVYAIIQSVSSDQFVAIAPINSENIAIYGADPDQEGAKLIIYNTQFKVSQSKQSFKLFSKAKKVWCVENFLFMCTGQNLAVVPFYVNTERLSAIIGSHKIDFADNDVQQSFCVTNWLSKEVVEVNYKIPEGIRKRVEDLLLQGVSEIAICDYLIPSYLESDEIDCLDECLGYFKDISEKCVVALLVYFSRKELTTDSGFNSLNYKMIDRILALPTTNTLLLPHLKRECDLPVTLCLIQYISYLLSLDGHNLPNLDDIQTELGLIEWGCALLDANYQKILLTSDANITDTLKTFKDIVKEHLDCMKDIRSVVPLCENIVKKRVVTSINHSNLKYCIKEMKLF